MREQTKYSCEKCDREFGYQNECVEHEKYCGTKKKFQCDKCSKIIEYTTENEYNKDFDFKYNECWMLTPNHFRAGYGSKMDGSEFKIYLCDDCLCDFIHTFDNAERLLNSGSNTHYDYPEDYEDGEDETREEE